MDELDDSPHATVTVVGAAPGPTVLKIAGELDISNVGSVEAGLLSLTAGDTAPITVDLSALTFMDSSGIAMLLRAADTFGSVTIREPSAVARQIIAATGLGEILRVEE